MFNPRCRNLYSYNLGLPPSLAVRVVEEAAMPAPLHAVLPTVARQACALLIGNALALLMHIGTLSGIVIAPPTDVLGLIVDALALLMHIGTLSGIVIAPPTGALGLIVDAPAMLMSIGLGLMIDVLGPLVDAQSHKILNLTMTAHGTTDKEMDMNLGATILIGTARGILPIAEIVLLDNPGRPDPKKSRRGSRPESQANKDPKSADNKKSISGPATSLTKSVARLYPLKKEGWCYYHHFGGHTTKTCAQRESVVPDRSRQHFRCQLHDTPSTRQSQAIAPLWNKAIEEPKTIEGVLGLLHCVDAWIEEYYAFIVERDSFQLKLLDDFLAVAEGHQELEQLRISLRELFTEANLYSERLVRVVGGLVKNFYTNDFVPKVRQSAQANAKHLNLGKKREKDLLAGSTPIPELFTYLPRVYSAIRASRGQGGEEIPPAHAFEILELQDGINTACTTYIGSKTKIAAKSEKLQLRELFGRTKHAKRQTVVSLMQPQMRSDMGDWIELPRIPTHLEWVKQSQLTQAECKQLEEVLRQEGLSSQLQPQLQPQQEVTTETVAEQGFDEVVVSPEARRLYREHKAHELAQMLKAAPPADSVITDAFVLYGNARDTLAPDGEESHHSYDSVH